MVRWLRKLLWGFIALLLVALVVFCIIRYKYDNVIRQLAEVQIRNSTSDLTNDAIAKQIANGNIAYDRYVFCTRMLPRWSSTMLLAMGRPNPVPFTVRESSAR